MNAMSQSTFLEYKEKLINLVNEINKGNDVLDEYYIILDNLLSYDLSHIFPNKWQGLTIFSDKNHIADFSKTKAIIDFNYVNVNGYADFRNCKIRNIKKIKGKMLGVVFDQNVYSDNPDIFLSNMFSESFKEKYNGSLLTFDDIVNLNDEQIKELREIMPKTYFLIPGYGAQGGKAEDIALGFKDGLGGIVNASRSLMAAYKSDRWKDEYSEEEYGKATRAEAIRMRDELNSAM